MLVFTQKKKKKKKKKLYASLSLSLSLCVIVLLSFPANWTQMFACYQKRTYMVYVLHMGYPYLFHGFETFE